MNIILGSGVVALIARHILGSSYKIINAGGSRFYKYNPALADNFIRCAPELYEYSSTIKSLGVDGERHNYKCCWSFSGEMIKGYDSILCSKWIHKMNINMSNHANILMKNRMEFDVHNTRVTDLYKNLASSYSDKLNEFDISNIKSIGDHVLNMKDGRILEFDKCISTIPLNDLYKLRNDDDKLESSDVTAVLLESDDINMEGFNQMFVVDDSIPFYKVIQVKPRHYVFYFTGKIEFPAMYIGMCVDSFDLISGMFIKNYIPSGELLKHDSLKKDGIIPVGMHSQWDIGMDISSCIYRIIKLSSNEIII